MSQIITEQTDGELYQAERHGFVPGIHASQNQQHGPYLASRVDKNEDREQDHINPKVAALQLAVTDRRHAHCFRYRDVLCDALTVIELQRPNVTSSEEERKIYIKYKIYNKSCPYLCVSEKLICDTLIFRN